MKDSTMLVFEPEAAALFCQYDFLNPQCLSDYEKSYLVVDCGGGTVDIAAHKMTRKQGKNIIIKELAPPSGGECGAFAINDQFELLLQKILKISQDDFVKLKENCSVQWNKMMNNDFEGGKLCIDPENPVPLTIDINRQIRDEISRITGKKIEDLIQVYNSEDIEWDDEDYSIILNHPAILQLFNPVLDKLYSLINEVLTREECQCITTVLMVGGFANSKLLFKNISARLKINYPYIETNCSSDPTFSVIKGAVLNAQLKNIMCSQLQNVSISSLPSRLESLSISSASTESASAPDSPNDQETTKYLPFVVSRKMKYTIGIEANVLFDESEHDSHRKKTYDGKIYCKNVFCPLVKANESIYFGSSKKRLFYPLTKEQSRCAIKIFATEKENVKYIDDADCHIRAQVVITDLPRYETNLSRSIEVSVDFYETEYEISACCVTVKEYKKVTVEYHFLPTKHLPPQS